MSSTITPGLLILHGNQMEMLREAVFDWLRRHPLGPLEQETILVQSNGFAEWLKIALAEELGVCAATRVALPARFLWEAYRAMLGRERVPSRSPFDRDPLTWRLMRLLPTLLKEPVFAPLTHFLGDGCPERRLQLAERLSDLFDQYQVYRADWLTDWEIGRDQLRRPNADPLPMAPDQLWQARLWRAVHESVPPMQRGSGRAAIHEVFVTKILSGDPPSGRLPRRVVLFGMSALPYQTLQAIAALSRHTQVLLAVPNPCQFYWGDIIEGRELLKAAHKRQPARGGVDLATLPIEELHAHSHPLLASWGRQGRDFVRMLDEFDNEEGRPETEGITKLRLDLFSDGDGDTLLQQVQAAVRDMRPLDEHPHEPPAPGDRSIEFHVTHSTQREVEALHDQLLSWFEGDPSLRPRDIVVMVPDIDTFSPAIHAVFDQHKRSDPRHIPFEIGDTRDRSVNPLLVALEWLLRLPQQRCRQSEIRDLLDVPAVAARFGVHEDDLHTLGAWIDGAGVRWGLDKEHRAGLGLGAAGEQNAWIFGVRRMLLGYASGAGARFGDIEPYGEVGGLDAALAGSLAQFVEALLEWRGRLAQLRTPAEWVVQARALLLCFFDGREEGDRLTLAQLGEALNCWLEMTDAGGFDEPVPLAVLREAWLGQIDQPTLNHQFVSGGVTFCTLMPMRAVPFRAVCLLGMNDGDFPRRTPQNDFDLLALPGMSRPGDRSRRDDDRYLMLEALLAARDKLYLSWVGRNVRDNSEQPASVLVAQLRDYLHAGWNVDLATLTTEHALQPFSRRYFEEGGLLTYAREWRTAHGQDGGEAGDGIDTLPRYELEPDFRLKLSDLASFVRQPARYFFRRRLAVVFNAAEVIGEDEEPFSLDALERYFLEDSLLDDLGQAEPLGEVRQRLEERAQRLAREGVLPIGLVGRQWQQQLVDGLVPVRSSWLALGARFPEAAPKLAISLDFDGLVLEDWIDRLRSDGEQTAWLMQTSSKVLDKKGAPRGDKLIVPWLRQLAASAAGASFTGYLVARDALVTMAPIDREEALAVLGNIVWLWQRNLDAPLPVACKTALAELAKGDARATYDGKHDARGEVEGEPCLARLWPEFAQLVGAGGWPDLAQDLYGGLVDWMTRHIEVAQHAGAASEEAQ
ncbi:MULTISPECIES: exodeoxyribonuclease V subunit gamma [unclassified Massilia]|uniref:exodeoxyribonuclease V subunit gamma n=1 Tax=unclassified Massilia TaxID=2609279 RepID=UPI00177D8FCA|nr:MULTISPECIES: exodeoxyribonuclease V subunit gamma [unclassified Massilia]MBD8530104.1 exodeoxyribonuclease V subunit gamma [Massilia sp. CFBP 13647]MBD8674067.1 exodeoxyribonuclease V subunit gamma [Massilia sp. CFBP 13721]